MEQNYNVQQPGVHRLKGSGLLKVTGILMIIGGGIGIIASIITIAGLSVLAAFAAAGDILNVPILYLSGAILIVGSVAQLIARIIGVRNHNNRAKAGTCLVWGIIVAVLSVLGSILTVVGGNAFPVLSFLLGLVLPILFIVGAMQNKKSEI